MCEEYKRITDILVKLTDAIGFNGSEAHLEAYRKAFEDLKKLIDDVDNAERL